MSLRHRVEYGAVRTAAVAVRILPAFVCRRLLEGLGLTYYSLFRRHRRVALDNLRRMLPRPEDDRLRRRIARGSFRNLGRLLFDLLWMAGRSFETIERQVETEGWEHLDAAYRRGRGVLLFSAHFGNWERVALLQGFRGRRLNMIIRPLDNPLLEAYFNRFRTRSGNRVIPKRGALRRCLRPIRNGEGIAIVIDQRVPWTDAVLVDFFGRPAATTRSLARLALRFGCSVIPVFSIPLPDGRYRIVYEPEVPLPRHGTDEDRIRDLTQRCTGVIERYVRRYPEFWFWMHRRWLRPAGEPVAPADGEQVPTGVTAARG
jgi:KDO2-lipid IV(A) lauroyltransferase